ncbi:BatA domain-containing protein [Aquimarina rhabdastrellae]
MQFKHPEFLYALFALIIPILVHLFQLRRFKKVLFTNVQFLKQVEIQTRKSSQIKKWLTLLARLLAFAAIVLAFAQPFFTSKNSAVQTQDTVIYLDNSFSMEAKGARGPLLQRSIQELISAIPEEEEVSLFTNDLSFKNTYIKDIQNDLLDLSYSANQLSYDAAFLKAKTLLTDSKAQLKRIILISDFQQKGETIQFVSPENTQVDLIQLQAETTQNIAIDTLFLSKNEANELLLNAQLSTGDQAVDNVSLALYNKDNLIAKTGITIAQNRQATTEFILPKNTEILGKLTISDPNITFDNTRYFTMNTPEKIKVLAINEVADDFIKRICTENEFELKTTSLKQLNYNDIAEVNVVFLNEIAQLPVSLINTLQTFMNSGGIVCFVPAINGSLSSYQQLIPSLQRIQNQEKKITTIAFNHPLYQGVFDKKITNFQYPKVNQYYTTSVTNAILSYEDSRPFLYQYNNLFVFTAALSSENSNFINAPLIVPTVYNIARQSLQLPQIAYQIGVPNQYDINTQLQQDEILSLVTTEEQVIPLQQTYASKVRITTNETPAKAGIYAVQNKEDILQYVSYNYNTSESKLNYHSLEDTANYTVHENVTSLFDQIQEDNSLQELWKWFVIFALGFLLIEILLLKHLK